MDDIDEQLEVSDPQELEAIEAALAQAASRTSAAHISTNSRKRALPESFTVHATAHAVHADLPPLEPGISKTGVGVDQDAQRLCHDWGLCVQGVVDLGTAARQRLQPEQLSHGCSLQRLCHLLLQGCLKQKTDSVRCGDWECKPLSAVQRTYAAADAYASLRCFEALQDLPLLPVPASSNTVAVLPPTTTWGCKVGALPTLRRLQPAKQAVLDAVNQGCGLERVAAQRGIRLDTVLLYLSEAVLAGHAYDPGTLGVARDRAAAVEAALQQHAPEAVEACRAAGSVDVLGELRTQGVGLREVEQWVDGLTGLGELRLLVAHAGRRLVGSNRPVFYQQH